MHVIGIDIGATNITAGIINESGTVLKRMKVETKCNKNGKAILNTVVSVVNQFKMDDFTINTVGIGAAGRIDKEEGTVTFSSGTIKNWQGTNIKGILKKELNMDVFVDNDVNAAALGSGWLGEGYKYNHYAFVTIGTGLGGALIHNEAVITSKKGGTGEFGHMILHPQGIACDCGQKGCAERYVSGTALSNFAHSINPDWNSFHLIELYKQGNKEAKLIMSQFIENLSTVLINIQNMYDPQAIILGGGLMDSFPVWAKELYKSLNVNGKIKVNVLLSTLGNNAGFIGAAKLAFNELKK